MGQRAHPRHFPFQNAVPSLAVVSLPSCLCLSVLAPGDVQASSSGLTVPRSPVSHVFLSHLSFAPRKGGKA